MRKVFINIIKVYQRLVSPFTGKNCRFYPSCSHYAIQSIERHGSIKGVVLSLYRIIRCNPFNLGGYDPVPGKRK